MIIKNILIENFQSYYKSQAMEFSRGLNLVIGNGGKGKSKLFNAFYWVLFGKIYITDNGWCSTDGLPHSSKFAMKRFEFINRKALSEVKKGDSVRTSVQIEFEDDRGMVYEIERSVISIRNEVDDWLQDSSWQVSNNSLKVSHDSTNGTKVKTGILASDTINSLFPEGIRNYIWFQGESLDSLINFRNKETLKNAVKHISYFPYYEKVSDIISKSKFKIERLESSKIRENNKHNTSVKGVLATIDKARLNIDNEEKNKSTLENNISKIQIALVEDEGKMSGLANFAGLVKDYDKCENDIREVMDKLTYLDDYQREQLPKLWILRGIAPIVEDCKQTLEGYTEEQNKVPEKKYLDNPSRTKLEEILHDGVCFVCGSKVEEESEAYGWIQKRLKEQEEYLREMEDYMSNLEFSKRFERFIGSIQDYPSTLTISLESIDKQFQRNEDEIEKLLALKRKLLERKKQLDTKIEEVKKKYGVNPVQQAHSAGLVENAIKASRSSLDREQRKLTASNEALSQYRADLRAAEKELDKLSNKKDGIAVSETEWKNISVFLEDICKRVQENARKDLLKKIETRANQFYQKFTEHDNGYKGEVCIGDDYSIEFDAGLNTSHEDRKKMSIINAMLSLNQEAIGTFYPFISDAPTSSFDIETTHKYLLGIKDIFDQSIVMTKDVDINSEKYVELSSEPNVSRIFQLNSAVYCEESKEPELHEVSTIVKQMK